MPKTLDDWMGIFIKIWALVSTAGVGLTHIAWLSDGRNVWVLMFTLAVFFLLVWNVNRYIERQIITPIREATAALKELQKSAAELGTAVGQQSNTVGALDAKIATTYEYIRVSLVDIQQRIPPAKKRD